MPSFDVVSKVQWNELDNALNQADKEMQPALRLPLDTDTSIEKKDESLDRHRSGERGPGRRRRSWSSARS